MDEELKADKRELYGYSLTGHIRTRRNQMAYERMSPLGQINHDARACGMSYGQYVGLMEYGLIPHKQELIVDGKVYIV